MINIIKGLSGSGKTEYIWNHILKNFSEKKENKKIMVIVPEQFSFEAEKMLCQIENKENLKSIEVVNFKRLANIILKTYGGLAKPILDDVKNNIILQMILSDIKDELKVYKRQVNNEAFCKDILSIFNIFKNNNISLDDIKNCQGNITNKLLKTKLQDILLIYERYQNKVNEKYIDNNNIINTAYKKLKENDFFNDYIIYIDSFRAFTESEYNLLEEIFKQSENVYISLCLKENCKKGGILTSIILTEEKLMKIARENKIEVKQYINLKTKHRFKNKELLKLSENIYDILDGNKIKCDIDYSNQNNFNITECKNMNQEIQYIASEISNLVKEEGCRFNEISVITRDINLYRSMINAVFKSYNIPYFLDERKTIKDKQLIIFVMTSLEAVMSNFKTISILKLLKTGLFDLDEDKISKLEIYCNIWNINGEMWLDEFNFNPSGFSEHFNEEDKTLLLEINEVRENIVTTLKNLKKNLDKNINGDDYIKTIYSYLINLEVPTKLEKIIEENKDDIVFDEELVKTWDSFIDILDCMSDLFGDINISLKDFINFLNIAIENTDIGLIPQTLDQVMVGQADHMVSSKYKVVFVIGLNQGLFPLTAKKISIFSDLENKNLIESGLSLYDNKIEYSLNERYYIYNSITSSSHKVYLSYIRQFLDGSVISKSFFINQIENLFNGLKIKVIDGSELSLIQNDETAYRYLCYNYNKDIKFLNSIKEYLKKNENYINKIKKIESINKKENFYLSDKNLLKRYLNNKLNVSPSSVERFYICNFKFFCKDILKIKNTRKVELNKMEQGVIIHHVLKEMLENSLYLKLDDIKQEIDKIINQYILRTMNKQLISNNKNKYISDELTFDISKLINYIQDEQKESLFKASEFEIDISNQSEIKPVSLILDTGEKIYISGKVDRVDICKIDNKEYIRIIDYKSGSKDFNLDDIYYGLNMQMMIYLFVLTIYYNKIGKKVLPAGALYLSVKEKIQFAQRYIDEDKFDKLIKKNFKMNGVLIDDIKILKLMEKKLEGNLIPVKLNKDGSLSKTSSVLNEAAFSMLEKYIKSIIIKMSKTIFDGKIKAQPVEGSRYENVCSYCEYKYICNLGEDKIFKHITKPPEGWLYV